MTQEKFNHEYVDDWVEGPNEVIEDVGIDENTEIAATGMPRAWFMDHRENEASSADKLLRNVFFQHGTDANVIAYRESDEFNVERALGEPAWKFPEGRQGRNEGLTIVEGPDASAMENVVIDPDLQVFAGATSYTGHELGQENRQSGVPYGRTDEILTQDLGADTGLVTVNNMAYFHDFGADERDEADFEEYVTRVSDQVDDLYESTTVIGERYDMPEPSEDQAPGMVYVLGEGRE